MTDQEKCPFCGDEGGYNYENTGQWGCRRQFDCGTRLFNDGIAIQSEECKDKQIPQLQEQIESLKDLHLEISALKERLEAWRDFYKWSDKDKYTGAMQEIVIAKLEDLGEI